MLSDSSAVFDPDHPEHPTMGRAGIRWERIPAIYSTQQLSREALLWRRHGSAGFQSIGVSGGFWGFSLQSLTLGLLHVPLPVRVGQLHLQEFQKWAKEEQFLC